MFLAAEASSGTRTAWARALAGIVTDTDRAAARAHLDQAHAAGRFLLTDAGMATLREANPVTSYALIASVLAGIARARELAGERTRALGPGSPC